MRRIQKGNIILAHFPFLDEPQTKLRPCLVLISNQKTTTTALITSQIPFVEAEDITLKPNPENGLKLLSVIKLRKIISLDTKSIVGILGVVSSAEIKTLNKNLITLLKL